MPAVLNYVQNFLGLFQNILNKKFECSFFGSILMTGLILLLKYYPEDPRYVKTMLPLMRYLIIFDGK